nr:MAG TPA: zinc finger protein [Caudoviricetes sp.]
MMAKKKRRTLPPPSPGTECYNLRCPYRHNSTQSAYSCAMVRLCAARKLERSRKHGDEP